MSASAGGLDDDDDEDEHSEIGDYEDSDPGEGFAAVDNNGRSVQGVEDHAMEHIHFKDPATVLEGAAMHGGGRFGVDEGQRGEAANGRGGQSDAGLR